MTCDMSCHLILIFMFPVISRQWSLQAHLDACWKSHLYQQIVKLTKGQIIQFRNDSVVQAKERTQERHLTCTKTSSRMSSSLRGLFEVNLTRKLITLSAEDIRLS